MTELAFIAFAWITFGALHSWLASNRLKHWVAANWPRLMPAYRLVFNLVALALLLPVVWLTHRADGAPLWHVPGWIAWPATVVSVAGFAWSLKWYDGATFFGTRQLRDRVGPDDEVETFRISPAHRHVRHPWYALMLLYLWTRDLNAAWLVAMCVITLYLLIGSRLEENKLIARYGDAYRRYRQRVPALVPVPGRSLSDGEARQLTAVARSGASCTSH